MIRLRSAYVKIFVLIGFVLFGLVLGLLSRWFHRHYDQWFPFDIPGDLVLVFWIQIDVLASIVAWTIFGILFTLLFKPRIIAWIMGLYVLFFGALWLIWESMHW